MNCLGSSWGLCLPSFGLGTEAIVLAAVQVGPPPWSPGEELKLPQFSLGLGSVLPSAAFVFRHLLRKTRKLINNCFGFITQIPVKGMLKQDSARENLNQYLTSQSCSDEENGIVTNAD